MMTDNMEIGRASVAESIELLKKVNREKPGLFILQLFLEAKGEEIINIFSQASPTDKAKTVNTLKEIDPANASKYDKNPSDYQLTPRIPVVSLFKPGIVLI